jgi:hypothetical protein
MKVSKFVFKLVDHDSQQVQKICITIKCFHKTEWDQPDMMKEEQHGISPGHKEWMDKHMKWKHATKETVAKIIKDKYPEIKDYTLSCCEECFESKIKNINHGEGIKDKPMHMIKIHGIDKHKMKYCKGTKKERKEHYKCTIHDCIYLAKLGGSKSDPLVIEADGEIASLTELCSFGLDEFGIMDKSSQGISIGEYMHQDKYMKYKQKYMQLKNGGFW